MKSTALWGVGKHALGFSQAITSWGLNQGWPQVEITNIDTLDRQQSSAISKQMWH